MSKSKQRKASMEELGYKDAQTEKYGRIVEGDKGKIRAYRRGLKRGERELRIKGQTELMTNEFDDI